jgi:hypothetical protein
MQRLQIRWASSDWFIPPQLRSLNSRMVELTFCTRIPALVLEDLQNLVLKTDGPFVSEKLKK